MVLMEKCMKRILIVLLSLVLSLSLFATAPETAEVELVLDLSSGEKTVIGFTNEPLDSYSPSNIQYDKIHRADTIDLRLRNTDMTAGHFNTPTYVYWYVYTPANYTIKVVGDRGLVGKTTGEVIPYTVMVEDKGQFTTDDRGERAIELYSKKRDIDPDFVEKDYKKVYIWAEVPEDARERFYSGKLTLEVSAT